MHSRHCRKHKRQDAAGGKRKDSKRRLMQMHADARRLNCMGRNSAAHRVRPWVSAAAGQQPTPSACISVHLLVSALILTCFAANRTSLDGEVQNHIQTGEAAGASRMATECEQTQPMPSQRTWLARPVSASPRRTGDAPRRRRDSWRPTPAPSGAVPRDGGPHRARIAPRLG